MGTASPGRVDSPHPQGHMCVRRPSGGIERAERFIGLDAGPVYGMAPGVEKIRPMPHFASLRLVHRKVEERFAHDLPVRPEAAAHEAPGGQNGRPGRNHRLRVAAPGMQSNAAGRIRIGAKDPVFQKKPRPEVEQAALEGLLEAQPRHPGRHGRDLEQLRPEAALDIGHDLRRAGYAEDGGQPDGLRPAQMRLNGRRQRFAVGRRLERPGQPLREHIPRGRRAREIDARRAQPRPGRSGRGRDLTRAEPLEALDIHEKAGRLAPADVGAGPHRRGYTVRGLEGSERGQHHRVAVGMADIRQPHGFEERGQFVEGRADRRGGNPGVGVLGQVRRQLGDARPGVIPDHSLFDRMHSDQVQQARGEDDLAGSPHDHSGKTSFCRKQGSAHAGHTASDHTEVAVNRRAGAHWFSPSSRPK